MLQKSRYMFDSIAAYAYCPYKTADLFKFSECILPFDKQSY